MRLYFRIDVFSAPRCLPHVSRIACSDIFRYVYRRGFVTRGFRIRKRTHSGSNSKGFLLFTPLRYTYHSCRVCGTLVLLSLVARQLIYCCKILLAGDTMSPLNTVVSVLRSHQNRRGKEYKPINAESPTIVIVLPVA